MDGPLKLGLIGAGCWGRNIIRTIDDLGGQRLHRLASTNPESKTLVESDCAVSKDWREVAAAPDLDGLIIAGPPTHHAEMAALAITAGIPVLIEKPLTLDVEEARTLLGLARKKAAIVLVDHIHLFHPAYVRLKHQGLGMGAVHAIRSVGGDWGPFRQDVSVLWDRGSHDVAMCLDLMAANPESISAHLKEGRETADGYGETITLKLDFPESITANIEVGNLMGQKKRFLVVHYDRETLIYDDLSEAPLVREPRPTGPGCEPVHAEAFHLSRKAPLACVLEAFSQAIHRGEEDLSGLELGVQVVEVLAVAEASLREGGKKLNFDP